MKPGDIFKLLCDQSFYVDFPLSKTFKTFCTGKNLILMKIKKSDIGNHYWFYFLGGFVCGNTDTKLPCFMLKKIG